MLNTISCTASLPPEKLDQIRNEVNLFLEKCRASKHQLQSIAGRLNFASQVVRGGRTFLRRILDSTVRLKCPFHKVKFQGALRQDLLRWQQYLVQFNGTSHFIDVCEYTPIVTDSCNLSGGAFCEGDFVYVNWEKDYPSMKDMHINYKEAAMAALSVIKWGPSFRNKTIILYTDNTTAACVINKCSAKNKTLMLLLREMFWVSAIYNFVVKARFLAGRFNVVADCISRLHEPGRLLHLESHINEWYLCHKGKDAVFQTVSFCNHMSLGALLCILNQVLQWRKQNNAWIET